MEPKYSILYVRGNLIKEKQRIEKYLKEGIKVFWFGSCSEVGELQSSFNSFCSAFFLQTFDISDFRELEQYTEVSIVDGADIDAGFSKLFDFLEENIPSFNAAQYRVEHCKAETNIVVKASAGTGKTTVMIDRILYLMHTIPNLSMSEIYMITFTNEAANQMNDRLQEMLLKKYALTQNKRYLNWLEQQSQMHISTIDSLAYELFKRFGTGVGFGRDLDIQPLEKERKDLIKDILSDKLNGGQSISFQIGMHYSEASKLSDQYWKELTRKGYTISDILNKNWGEIEGKPALANFQTVLQNLLGEFEDKYQQLKLDENAISINDLFFDFGHFLLDGRVNCDGLNLKYLFVDEFQDTDATQIRTFARLVQTIGARLFVVGDTKQSIYGFKGATDEAFDILQEEMKGKLRYYSLRNNYRTCANIMEIMEKYFFAWSEGGLLQYEESVRPFNQSVGSVYMDYVKSSKDLPDQTMDAINDALNDLEIEVRSGRKKVTDKTKVAVLVRGNKKALEIANLCRSNGKTVVLNSDRPFFLSKAVRDFYAFICSYIFAGQPIYTYNYLMTPYASYKGAISVQEMEKIRDEGKSVQAYLEQFLSQTNWQKYQRDFRLKPILSVIKDVLENENIIDNYIALDKVHMNGDAWTDAKRNKQAYIDAKLYQKNLDKLMEIIQQRMDGEFATLYDLYVYLTLMIATNREEKEPDIDMTDDYTSVYIMTVHKSKGLEYDTVIMPAMNANIIPQEDTTILANDKKVAWFYNRSDTERLESAWYKELRKEAVEKGIKEETRILYVGMTRAVNNLILLVNDWDFYESWSSLIRKVGLINE